MKNHSRITIAATLLAALMLVSGCAADRALNHPDAKDPSVLAIGTPRAKVVAELGSPVLSETTPGGNKKDIFKFIHGLSDRDKVGRAIGHSIGHVLTFGAWDVIANPAEATSHVGDEIRLIITYDSDNRLSTVEYLAGQGKFIPKE